MSVAGERHITTSSDGSTTIWVPGLDEHYHSIHGARTESQHVFIDAGLKATAAQPVRILEVGLGTALNAQLTFETAKELGMEVLYHKIRSTDEFLVEKKGPLVLPPDYNEIPAPDTIIKKMKTMKIKEKEY